MAVNSFNILVSIIGLLAGFIYLFEYIFGKAKKRSYRVILVTIFFISIVLLGLRFLKDNKTTTADLQSDTPPTVKTDSIKQPLQTIPQKNTTIPARIVNTPIFENDKAVQSTEPKKEIETPTTDVGKKDIENALSNYINNTSPKSDIAVLVIDNNNRSINSISSEIATLYRSKGHSATTSLFTNSFLNSPYLNEVQTGNSKVIDKLGLASQVSYIVIAKYSNDFNSGEQTKWISRANLDVSVISCLSKSQVDGFTIAVSNGFDDKQHAEIGAKEKIILSYKTSHLNL